MNQESQKIYEFGVFRLDIGEGILLREGHPVSLQRKTFETLCVLVERSGYVVERDELMDKLWPDTFVEENNLTQHIRALRKALGEGENGSVFIETIPRRGYRFLPEVRVVYVEVETEHEFHSRTRTRIVTGTTSTETVNQLVGTVHQLSAPTTFNSENASSEKEGIPPQTQQRFRSWLKPLALITAVLLLIFGGIVWNELRYRRQTQTAHPTAPSLAAMQLERLTAKGNIYDPAISPDGKFLAYTVREETKQSLWLRDLTGKSETQLIPPREWMMGTTVFAPDGGSLYFWGREGAKDGAAYQIPLLGGEPRKIVEGLRSGVGLSPDGKQLAYIRFDGNQQILSVCKVDGSGERSVAMAANGGTFVYHTWGIAPSWSPDGSKLVVSANELINEKTTNATQDYFFEVSIADGAKKKLVSPRWYGTDTALWLPDGRGLIVIAQEQRGAPFQLWYLSYPDGAAQRITNDLNLYTKVSMTADGKSLVAAQEIWNDNIWILPNAEASRARQITHVTSGAERHSIWTPDGRLIFHLTSGAATNLWVMNADGQHRQPLTFEEDTINISPILTPDNRHILFNSNRTGVANIWQIDMDGRNPSLITEGEGELLFDVTPDGRWIVYASIKHWPWTLWKKPLDGGEAMKLSEQLYQDAKISPDGKQILFGYYEKDAADGNPWKIAIMPFDGSAPPRIIPLPAPPQHFDWSADGRSIYFLKKGNAMNVWQYSLDGKLLKQVTDFTAEASGDITHFAWSSDGKQLAITRGVKISDAILISGFR